MNTFRRYRNYLWALKLSRINTYFGLLPFLKTSLNNIFQKLLIEIFHFLNLNKIDLSQLLLRSNAFELNLKTERNHWDLNKS